VAFILEPLVAGELGAETVLDPGTHPPLVRSVEFMLDSPTEEDLVESFPVFLVSEELGDSLTAAGLVGFHLDHAGVHPSTEYVAAYGDVPHKAYRWLRLIWSSPSDCWLDEEYRLCVSDRMYSVIARHRMEGCQVTPTT
jgi:hypothetical protein